MKKSAILTPVFVLFLSLLALPALAQRPGGTSGGNTTTTTTTTTNPQTDQQTNPQTNPQTNTGGGNYCPPRGGNAQQNNGNRGNQSARRGGQQRTSNGTRVTRTRSTRNTSARPPRTRTTATRTTVTRTRTSTRATGQRTDILPGRRVGQWSTRPGVNNIPGRSGVTRGSQPFFTGKDKQVVKHRGGNGRKARN